MFETLSVMLPSSSETALLRACLHSGAAARSAWADWRQQCGHDEDVCRRNLAASRTLLPLLSRSASRNDLDLGPGVLAYVRAAALREELRAVRYRRIAAEALDGLYRDGVTAFVTRGAALAATAYESWPLRHCHDLDLLVQPDELTSAVHALSRLDCTPLHPQHGSRHDAVLRHASGLELALHARPFAIPYYDAPLDRFARGARSISIDGIEVRMPSPEAILVHVLGHASYAPSRRRLCWVADAWHLVARPTLDWTDVVARIHAYRLGLPVSVLLHWLAEFGVPVPHGALSRVDECAAVAGGAAADVALGGLRGGPDGDLRSLWRSTASWRGRARLVRWMLAPSRGYVRSAFGVRSAWMFPLCYAYRPARFVAGRFIRRAMPAAAERRT